MAKNRMVSTSFWSDNYAANLDPIEKLLFLYLLTCERSTLAGVYELPLKLMAVETGIENEMVRKILGRFEEDEKIKYYGGWVAIKNFLKHHEHGSPTVKKGIEDAILSAPAWAREFIGKGIDTISPSASSLSYASRSAEEPREEIYSEEEENPRVKNKVKYPHALEVFSWFPNRQKSWESMRNVMEREYAEFLYERGEDAVRGILAFLKKHEDVEFCPTVVKPSDLERKWLDIIKFAERNGL